MTAKSLGQIMSLSKRLWVEITSKSLGQIIAPSVQFLGFDQVYYEMIADFKLSRNITSDIEGILETIGQFQGVVTIDQTQYSTTGPKYVKIAVIVENVNKRMKGLAQKVALYNNTFLNQYLLARNTAKDIRKEIDQLKAQINISRDNVISFKSMQSTITSYSHTYSSTTSLDTLNQQIRALQRHKDDMRRLKMDIQPKMEFCQALAHKVYPFICSLLLLIMWLSARLPQQYSLLFILIRYFAIAILLAVIVVGYRHRGNCCCWINPTKKRREGE